jgi:hypothetical protein
VDGNCESFTVIESWSYAYDGDGVRVAEAHFVGLNEYPDWTKSYYTSTSLSAGFGGAYETHSDPSTGSGQALLTRKYYREAIPEGGSLAGQSIACAPGTWNLEPGT